MYVYVCTYILIYINPYILIRSRVPDYDPDLSQKVITRVLVVLTVLGTETFIEICTQLFDSFAHRQHIAVNPWWRA